MKTVCNIEDTHLSRVSPVAGAQVGGALGFLFGKAPSAAPAAPACFSICQTTADFMGEYGRRRTSPFDTRMEIKLDLGLVPISAVGSSAFQLRVSLGFIALVISKSFLSFGEFVLPAGRLAL